MDKPKFTIADGEFLPYGKSESIGGDNIGVGPTYFEWEAADPQTARFVTDRYLKDARGPGQVAWLSETFFLHPENFLDAMRKPFDAVLTHNRYFVENIGWKWFPHGGSWIDFEKWGMHPKKKSVSILLSDKKSMRGHALRHEVVERFGDKLDVFGFPNRINKFEALAPYRYSIVIEAEKCPGFFSEKLIDCISVGTIPIYWGDPDIARVFSSGVIQFNTLDELGTVLQNISTFEYIDSMYDTEYNIDIARHYRISEDWIYEHYFELFKDAT
jgi:hypothetical protein